MRSLVLSFVLLFAAAFAVAQAVPPVQQTPPANSQIPAEPGTPPTLPRAQMPPDQPAPPAEPSNAQSTSPTQQNHASANPLSLEGCLSGTNGNFSLTDGSRGTYQLIGADSKLDAEVGHTIRVTGMPANAAGVATEASGVNAKPEQEENQTKAESTNPSVAEGQPTLQVSTVKEMSKTCNDVPQR